MPGLLTQTQSITSIFRETPSNGNGQEEEGQSSREDRRRADTVIKLYDPLIKLLTHKHTCKLFKRQAEAVKKIVRLRKNGLYFSDLVPVRVIMQHLIDSVISHGQDAVLEGVPHRSARHAVSQVHCPRRAGGV